MIVIIVKEVMTGDVSPVAMFVFDSAGKRIYRNDTIVGKSPTNELCNNWSIFSISNIF